MQISIANKCRFIAHSAAVAVLVVLILSSWALIEKCEELKRATRKFSLNHARVEKIFILIAALHNEI